MSLLSSTASITRYRVDGKIESNLLETIYTGLKEQMIPEIEDASEKVVGWTSFDNPFNPNFEGSSFSIGNYLIFSLRIDKKTIPPKIIKKYYEIEMNKRLKESGREYLSRQEQKMAKDHVINVLALRIPATPNIYDLVWNYEESVLWFFSNLKAANEELEDLFFKSFKLNIIRLFPYTVAHFSAGLSDLELDSLNQLQPAGFF